MGEFTDVFGRCGIFAHADIVELSLQMRGPEGHVYGEHLASAFDLRIESQAFRVLARALLEYARPIPHT